MSRVGLLTPYPAGERVAPCRHTAVIYVDEYGVPRCSACRVERSRHVQLSARLGIPSWRARCLCAAIDANRVAVRRRWPLRVRLVTDWCMWWLSDDDEAWPDRRAIAGIAHRAARGTR